jgi:hypothetical protein
VLENPFLSLATVVHDGEEKEATEGLCWASD